MTVGMAIGVHEGWLGPSNGYAAATQVPLSTREEEAVFAAGLATLTRREREMVRFRAAGMAVNAIADHCFLSRASVRNHLNGAFRKLGVEGVQRPAERACYLLGRIDARADVRDEVSG